MTDDKYKNCSFCDEKIKAVAIKCRYCETLLYDENQVIKESNSFREKNRKKQMPHLTAKYQHSTNPYKRISQTALAFAVIVLLVFGGFFSWNYFHDNDDNSLLNTDSEFADDMLEEGKEVLTAQQEADNVIELTDTAEISGIDLDENALDFDFVSEEEEVDESTIAYNTISWNGGTYSGPLENGVPQGWGTWNDHTGKTYTGDFINGEMTGYGTMVFSGGEEYIGFFKDGLGHGQGSMTHPDGRSVNGAWIEGVYQGN